MQRPCFSEALRLASYCPPPVQPILPVRSPNVVNVLNSPLSSSVRTPSLATASSNDHSNSASLSSALPASAPPQPSRPALHPSLNSSSTASWGIHTDHSRDKRFDSMRAIPITQSMLREKWTGASDNEAMRKAHQTLAVHRDQLQSSVSTSTPSTFIRALDDSTALARQELSNNSDTATRIQLLELQKKYDALLMRLDQKTMTSESLAEDLRSMQDDLNKARKGCVTLADIVHDIAYDEFQSPLPSHSENDDQSAIESSVNISAASYTAQSSTKSKHKNVVKQEESCYPIDLTRPTGSSDQSSVKFTTSPAYNALSRNSPDVILKASPTKLVSGGMQEKSPGTALSSKALTPTSHIYIREAALRDTPELSVTRATLRGSGPLPSPNTSIPSSSGSSRASSRKSSGRRRACRSSSRRRKRKPTNNQLYTTHRRQIPMIVDLIKSTEAELRSFQKHLDEVLKIAKQDPNRTWERGEEIRLLCQAISAKKAALNKLWILRGETDKALDAMESDIDQMHVLGHRIRARLETHEDPMSARIYRSNSARISGSTSNSTPQKWRLSRSAKASSTRSIERIYPLASEARPRSTSASKRHEKCVARPVFEPFKARPNPFAP